MQSHPPPGLTDLPGQWLQCQANDSKVCRVLRPASPSPLFLARSLSLSLSPPFALEPRNPKLSRNPEPRIAIAGSPAVDKLQLPRRHLGVRVTPNPETRNPKPETRNPKPETLAPNPKVKPPQPLTSKHEGVTHITSD